MACFIFHQVNSGHDPITIRSKLRSVLSCAPEKQLVTSISWTVFIYFSWTWTTCLILVLNLCFSMMLQFFIHHSQGCLVLLYLQARQVSVFFIFFFCVEKLKIKCCRISMTYMIVSYLAGWFWQPSQASPWIGDKTKQPDPRIQGKKLIKL